jgi:hypothetical protein
MQARVEAEGWQGGKQWVQAQAVGPGSQGRGVLFEMIETDPISNSLISCARELRVIMTTSTDGASGSVARSTQVRWIMRLWKHCLLDYLGDGGPASY